MVCETPCRTKGRTVQAQPEKNEHGTCFPFDVVNSKGNNPQIHAMQTPIFCVFLSCPSTPKNIQSGAKLVFRFLWGMKDHDTTILTVQTQPINAHVVHL